MQPLLDRLREAEAFVETGVAALRALWKLLVVDEEGGGGGGGGSGTNEASRLTLTQTLLDKRSLLALRDTSDDSRRARFARSRIDAVVTSDSL